MSMSHGVVSRWFRFSLRTLFLAVTACAVSLVAVLPLLRGPKAFIEAKAIAAVAKQTSTQSDQLQASAMKVGAEWSVVVWRLPETPGGHMLLVFSEAGELKESHAGL